MAGSLDGKRVAVTGADGFIGSALTERLVRDGAQVRALAQYNAFGARGWIDRMDPSVRGSLDCWAGDVRDPYFVQTFCENQDIVLHLAALIGIPFSYHAPQSYVDVNVAGTLNVLEACRRLETPRLVHTSTSEVYGTARFTPITEAHPLQGQSPYSASKIGADHMAEAYWRSFGTPVVILRPFNTYGPRQSERAVIPTVIRQMLDPACDVVKIGDLSPIRDFNYVEDIADAFCRLATAETVEFGTVYNAGSGRAITIGDMIAIVRGLCPEDKPVDEEASRRRPPKSEVFELLADASRLEAATGWRPSVPLETGLERTLAWWAEEIAAGRQRADSAYQV